MSKTSVMSLIKQKQEELLVQANSFEVMSMKQILLIDSGILALVLPLGLNNPYIHSAIGQGGYLVKTLAALGVISFMISIVFALLHMFISYRFYATNVNTLDKFYKEIEALSDHKADQYYNEKRVGLLNRDSENICFSLSLATFLIGFATITSLLCFWIFFNI